MRHHQMFVHEKLQRLGVGLFQAESRRHFRGNSQADVAMVFHVTLAQVVQEQGEV
ncbi:MAG: hypothetical protein QM775_00515 [Pirellulales bacterium]